MQTVRNAKMSLTLLPNHILKVAEHAVRFMVQSGTRNYFRSYASAVTVYNNKKRKQISTMNQINSLTSGFDRCRLLPQLSTFSSISLLCPKSSQNSTAGHFYLRDQICLLGMDLRSIYPASNSPHQINQIRRKSRRKQGSTQNDDMDSDEDEDDALEADDFDAPAKFKVMKIHTASMRTDAVISNSLGVARNRLEEAFYGSGLLLNGSKMLKKSVKMEEGDYVDLVTERTDDQLKVKRVKVMKIYDGKTNTDKLTVKVRVWKIPFLVDKPESGRRQS